MNRSAKIFTAGLLPLLLGCAQITDTVKKFWGTSTTALDHARLNALSRSYACGTRECFEAVLSLARNEEALEPKTEKFFDVFLKDPRQRHIVVMGIEGNVDTTEVGIFFDSLGGNMVKVDISSLSTSAKNRAAKAVFAELDQRFQPSS